MVELMDEIEIVLPDEKVALQGCLTIPLGAKMVVVFAHGSGSGRFSPRNQSVARFFNKRKLATLLLDLLTEEEGKIDESTRQYRFDIPRLAGRLTGVQKWLKNNPSTQHLKVGLFGSSTGAAAALITAAGSNAAAVVSRGGRTDLADEVLSDVKAPTLFIVGALDFGVIELNEASFAKLNCEKKLEIVPRATHLFEEPGALEVVARLAAEWFVSHA
jgi:putative phosphoribosyl transferase